MKQYSIGKIIFSVLFTAAITATVLIYFTPGQDINKYLNEKQIESNEVYSEKMPTLLPNEQSRIGIVSGHWGYDSGHVCPPELNNIREVDVALRISTLVRDMLSNQGYTVDLFKEFDPKLKNYTGLALLSIHTDTCEFINNQASGFKVTSIGKVSYPVESTNLNNCLIDRFQRRTNLNYLGNTISSDPEEFYDFSEINEYTTAAIMEVGYLNLDYRTLTEKTDSVAKGIADGILCYINNESATTSMEANKPIVYNPSQPETKTKFILPGVENITP